MKNFQRLPRIACVWLPNWPLQRLLVAGKVAEGRCVVLYEARPQGGLKVAACSRNARLMGVSVGMPLAEALALVGGESAEKNSDAERVVQAHQPEADRLAIEELANWCQQFSPSVSVEEVPQPSSLLLDVTGIGTLFGGDQQLAEHICDAFAERGLWVRIAIADSLGGAWALAHYAEHKMVVTEQSMEGELSPGAALLLPLPIAAIRLASETVECLESLGIYRIEQLLQLPRETLASRLGTEVLLRLDQALGLLPEAVVAQKLPPELQVEWVLEHATDRREMIDFVLQSLVERLVQSLAARQEGVLKLECRLKLQSAKPVEFCVGLYRPCASAKHLLGLLNLQLEKVQLRAPVADIALTAAATGVLEREQQALFAEERSQASPRHLATLVDRLASRLGREWVLRARLFAEAQPEHTCRFIPLAGQRSVRRQKKALSRGKSIAPQEPEERRLPLRPLRMMVPKAIEVMSLAPTGSPIRFRAAGTDQHVLHVWGPERIETGWWRRQGVRRDYYRVETETGQRFWLFRRSADRRWFVQGVFD